MQRKTSIFELIKTSFIFLLFITRGRDGDHPPSLVTVLSSEPSDRPLLWNHLLLPLDHVIRRKRLRHLHLPQSQEPQDTGEGKRLLSIFQIKLSSIQRWTSC